MGWPDETPLLKTFYPTSVLVTGFDILFFWVARMMMMGIHFMKDVPFFDVYVHALVRDEDGKKMSKSKGNVIDPLEVIDEYGTDAFRYTLAAFAAQGRDIKLSKGRVEGYRHFINKLWNAARFALMHIKDVQPDMDTENITLADRWILSRLNRVTDAVAESLDNYRFNDAAASLYKFVWHEFCDWYLEAIKPTLYGEKGETVQAATLSVLWRVLHNTIVLLHPFIPFVTEEIWHKLPGTEGSVMKAVFPADSSDSKGVRRDLDAELTMDLLIQAITGIRNIRGEMNISPSLALTASIQPSDETARQIIQTHEDVIKNLARLDTLLLLSPGERPKSAATALFDGGTIFVSLEGIIDFAKEAERLEKEIGKLSKELVSVSKKLENQGFLQKAPAHVVAKVRDKQNSLGEKQQKYQEVLDRIKAMQKEVNVSTKG